jgi:hypothetical protein
MQCKNHPSVEATDRCAGCAEPFCPDCVVEIHGQKYCAQCKVSALKGPPQLTEEATLPCKEANEALTYAIVSIFCFGIILAPVALIKASKAKKMIDLNPRLSGSGKIAAARIIASVALVLWIVGVIAKINTRMDRY